MQFEGILLTIYPNNDKQGRKEEDEEAINTMSPKNRSRFSTFAGLIVIQEYR